MMSTDKKMQFYQLLRDFLTDYLVTRRNFSDKTVRAYKQSLKLLRKYFSDEKGISFDSMDFSCFSRSNIYGYLMWLKDSRNCSYQTLNLRLAAIKSFLKFCSEEHIELTPIYLEVCSIHTFRASKKERIEYLNQAQIKNLFLAPDATTKLGRRDRFFMIFAYETGARLQELLSLTCDSIVYGDHSVQLRIQGKGHKTRYVPLLKATIKHLEAYLNEFHDHSDKSDFLFYTIHDSMHTQMKPGTVDHFLKKYARLAYNRDPSFPINLHAHMLRHSIAMAMYKKGIPISYIKDFLGHKSLETTSVYSYADGETIKNALESVQDIPNLKQQKKWKGKEEYLLEFCGLN